MPSGPSRSRTEKRCRPGRALRGSLALPLSLVSVLCLAPAQGGAEGQSQIPIPLATPRPQPEASLGDTTRVPRFPAPAPPDSLPAGWLPISFGGDRGTTEYREAQRDGRDCLLGEAHATGSGLVKPLVVDPTAFPRLLWSWWVPGPVSGGDVHRKEGDDFAARIYVNFRFEPSKAGIFDRLKHRLAGDRFGGEAPGRSLVYVWGNVAPPETVVPNAYTDKAMVVVVRSGTEGTRRWWAEERNILEDFREAFGYAPPEITSLAIMTDADDTGSTASACYGDIFLLMGSGTFGSQEAPRS
jgi:hypothetical protein